MDYFSFLSEQGEVALDAIKGAAEQVIPHQSHGMSEQEAVDAIAKMLKILRQGQKVDLATIIRVNEEFLDDASDLPRSHTPWWQELRHNTPLAGEANSSVPKESPDVSVAEGPEDFTGFYQGIVSALPETLPSPTSYLDVWQNDKKSFLDDSISRLSKDLQMASQDDIAGDLGTIADDFYFCQRCAEDCGLQLSAQFLAIAHGICLLAIHQGVHLNSKELAQFEHGLLRCIDVIWEIRTFIANGGDERQYWLNPVSRENFLAVRVQLAAIRQILEAAS